MGNVICFCDFSHLGHKIVLFQSTWYGRGLDEPSRVSLPISDIIHLQTNMFVVAEGHKAMGDSKLMIALVF